MLTGKLSLVFEPQACIGSKRNETDKYYTREKQKIGSTRKAKKTICLF
jgi:hypothetical protein